MTLAQQIKAGRKRAGLTQQQVAEVLGVAKSSISRYEVENETNIVPPLDKLEKMSELFGVKFTVRKTNKPLVIESEVKEYTVWKDNWPIGTMNLCPWQAEQANAKNRDVYFAPKREEDDE